MTALTREQEGKSTSLENFVNAIRSPATKTVYINSLKRYMNYIKVTEVDSLSKANSTKVIESQLIDYIMSLRNDNISYSTIKYLVAPIFTFYQLNDVTLNKKKVFRYLGEYKRVVKDKAYTTDQIRQALQNADQRDVLPAAMAVRPDFVNGGYDNGSYLWDRSFMKSDKKP